MAKKKYVANFERYRSRQLLIQLTASVLSGNRAWRKDPKLACLEYDLETAMAKVLRSKGIEVVR